MTWNIDGPQGNESGKIKWEIVRYTRGRGLDLGCGMQKTFPHFVGVDSGKDTALFGHHINPDVRVETAAELPMFASGSMDFVFSSHLLEHFPLVAQNPEDWPVTARAMAKRFRLEMKTALQALTEWMRVIKMGGYLVLYVPDEDEYPKVGEEGANPDHCFNVNYDTVIGLMKKVGCGWDLIDFQKRNAEHEYSLYFVFKKAGGHHESWKTKQRPAMTAGVVRYGAYGDLLQTSSVLKALHDEGYHTTLYTSPPGNVVVQHDPHIDAFYLQDVDQVPNAYLGHFWAHEAKKYDKWVNLSESVECTLLAVPGRTPFTWAPAARHRYMNHNYVQLQHEIAGVPFTPEVRFYALPSEHEWAKRERQRLGGHPLILWALSGSSVHKTWGGLDATIASILVKYPKAHIVLVGGDDAVLLEQGWDHEPRVKCRSGKYSIRETMSLLEHVDVMIGPETGVMNGGSQLDCEKIVFLSHSTHENLTRDWRHTTSIGSKATTCPGRGENQAPACHQMHYTWDACKQYRNEGDPQDGTAQCMADIDGEAAWHLISLAIDRAIGTTIEVPQLILPESKTA